jgi:uncharacterized protein YbcC (UPF0753/DUF2309 family)
MTTLTPSHFTPTQSRDSWLDDAHSAAKRIPPLWPLKNFVAVNPFLGLTQHHFLDTCALLDRVAHQPALMTPSFFDAKLRSGAITESDLQAALELAIEHLPTEFAVAISTLTVTHLKLWLHGTLPSTHSPATLQTLAEFIDSSRQTGWNQTFVNEISKHCSSYCDEGQSAWRMPWASQSLYAAWKEAASIDANLDLLGLKGFRTFVASLPPAAESALPTLLNQLRIPPSAAQDYLHRLLLSIFGWSAHVQFRVRQNGLNGIPDDSLIQLLTIRLAHDAALASLQADEPLLRNWTQSLPLVPNPDTSQDLASHYTWHLASEIAYQRRLIKGLQRAPACTSIPTRAALQAVFCIDVRSEVFRRSLEAAAPGIETLGFAGFFGMPIEHIPLGYQHGDAQCPVLLTPKYRIRERLAGTTPAREDQVVRRALAFRRLRHAWNAFKTSAVSCFSFVEAAGLGFAVQLARNTFLTHPHKTPDHAATAPHVHASTCQGDCSDDHSDQTGIPPGEQITLAHGALQHMGLTSGFARIVLLCGHSSESANNPYAASLDCGACGGHSGQANARVAATLLNLPHVRSGLHALGIHIPADTVFIAGLHSTTTDEVTLFDLHRLPDSHSEDLNHLQFWLHCAGKETRSLRTPLLGIQATLGDTLDRRVTARASDWSQVRPEWGLAGNAAFIAAPRERTRHLNLGGRVFLHNYHHERDTNNATLELILNAPMIVASWINLQYYGSTVNNDLFGSGNKVLHNVVGTLGVCIGNGGDIRTGLPLQSLHDGEKWIHDPLRLSVFIEAHREHLSLAISRHPNVAQLVDNAWIHLFAIEPGSSEIFRYLPNHQWTPVG